MLLRPILLGIVEIDAMAGETFLFECLPRGNFSREAWRQEFAGQVPCAVLAADLPHLRQELAAEFWRLQARLAA